MAIKMQIRRGTLAAWAAASNPVLEPGELGFVTDVGKTAFKIGDTAGTGWNTLPYVNSTYPELDVSAGNNLNTSLAQGRYPLLTGTTYTNIPTDFGGTTTDGNSILLVTVPTNSIVIQELTTSLTSCKQWIRAYTGTWTAWKRIDTLSATESLSITNLTLTGTLTIPAGAVGTPSLTFTGDTNTGVYSIGADNLSITTNGVQRLSIGSGTPTINATGSMTVSSTLTASNALTVSTGTTNLKTTVVDGLLQVSASTPANKLTVGSIRSATVGLTEIYLNSSPYLKVMPPTGAAASDLVWTGTNAASNPTTTIRCDGVPTASTDLTTKSYVDLNGLYQYVDVIDSATSSSPTNIPIAGTAVPVNSPFNSRSTVTEGTTYWYKASFTGNNAGFDDNYGIMTITLFLPSSYDYELVIGIRSTGLFLTNAVKPVDLSSLVYALSTTIIKTSQSTSVNELITGYQINVAHGNGDTLTKSFWYGVRVLGPANRPGMAV